MDGTGPLAISVNDDNLAEGDETIDIAGAADGFTVASTSIGLTDNDAAPTSITLTVDTASLGEDAGDTEVQVTATLGDGSTAILDETTVAVSFGGTDEALGSDYEASDFTITVAAGAVDGSSTLTLTPNDDNLAEGDETIEVSGSADGFTVVSAEIGLTDNDVAPASITLTVADPASLAEGAGETAVTVTATLGDGSTALLTETQVTLSLSGTDEALGPDYTAGEVTITVAPGATAGSGPVPVSVVDDILAEGDETIQIAGAAEGFSVEPATVALIDNDTAPTAIILTVDTASLDEGAGETAINVTATLGDGSTALLTATEVTLSLSGTDEALGSDYEASEVTIAIDAGAVAGSSTLTLTPNDDNLAEGDESIEVAGAAGGFTVVSAEIGLTDNDVAPTLIALTVDTDTFDEGDGETSLTVTATLGDGSTALLTDTEVSLAIAESDENAATGASVTIGAGETSVSGSLSLTLIEENLVDGDKVILLTGNAAGFNIGDLELTVTDNDIAPTTITLEVDNNTFDEGDGEVSIAVTATLGDGSTALLHHIDIDLAVAASDENAAAGAAVRIEERVTVGSGPLVLTLIEENLVDGDKTITLTGTADGYDIGDVTLTVTDNDVAPTTITLTPSRDSFDESDGETAITFTAVLGDGGTALLNDTQITLSISSLSTAEEGEDYAAIIPTITVAATETSASGVLTLTPPDELIPESTETIIVEGSASGFTVSSVTITITDDDDEPTVVTPIPAMTLYVGGADGVVDLSDKFRGLDMTFSATSSNSGVATVSVDGSRLTVSAVIEGDASVEVTAMNTIGPDATQAFSVSVITEPNETQIVTDALAAIGRTTLASVSTAIGTRFSSRPSLKVNLAGYSLLDEGAAAHLGVGTLGLQNEMRYAMGSRNEMSWQQALRSTSFAVPMGESGGGSDPNLPNWTIWGLGDYNTFEGTPDYGSHSGTVTSVYLGADKRVASSAQVGATVSYSMGETDYDFEGDGASGSGALTTVLTSVYPYLRVAPSKGVDIWAIGGLGVGTVENERGVSGTTEEGDLAMALAILGARRSLGNMGGLDVALRGDAGTVNLSTAEAEGVIADQAVAAQRFRLGLEGAHTFQMSSCAKVTPYGEVSGRFDGGDGQTGGGLEAAGGLRYECPRSRFRLEARGRVLALNSAYSETGGSVMASYSPGADGLGLSMALAPSWGASGGGAQALLRDDAFRRIGHLGSTRDDWSMDAQVGYGMRLQPVPGVLTPFALLGPAGAGSQMRLGVRFEGLRGTAFELMDLDVSAGRIDRRQAENRVDVRGAMNF